MSDQATKTAKAAPVYLTPQELVTRLRDAVTIKTLGNWRCKGIGPKFTKIGGQILYPEHEVEAWEEQQTVSSTSQYHAPK